MKKKDNKHDCFLGFRYYDKLLVRMRNRNKRKLKGKIRLYKKGMINGDFLNGYKGYLKLGKIKKPFKVFGLEN